MAECRHLLCDQQADFIVTVRTTTRNRAAAFCTKHLQRATDDVSKYDDVSITGIQPIEKGTTMREKDGDYRATITRQQEEIAQLKQDVTIKADRITRLEADVNRQGEGILQRNEQINTQAKAIAGLKEALSNRDRRITDLEHDNSQMKATLSNRDARVHTLVRTQDALVSSLHVLADNAEDEGRQDLAEEVDALLGEHNLRPRKQEYTIEILVPTRLHLHVTARSMNNARRLYETGEVDWNVADGEIQEDDIKILDISEGSL